MSKYTFSKQLLYNVFFNSSFFFCILLQYYINHIKSGLNI